MRSLLRPAAASIAVAALVVSAAVAGALQAGEPFTVAPTQGGPFTVVAVSGEGCEAPSVVGTVVGAPEVGVITQFVATPDAGGDWSTTFTVPPNKPAGSYQVTARCGGNDYASQAFTVLQGDTATMTVAPLAARSGTDVVVTVSGTLCRGQAATVDVGLFVRLPNELGEADEFVDRRTATPDGAGTWATQLTIPATAAPGTYGVGAQCILGDAQFFLYTTVDIVLSAPDAPPAVPVTGRPTFTG